MVETANEWLPHWPTVTLTDKEYYESFVEMNSHFLRAEERPPHHKRLEDFQMNKTINLPEKYVITAIDKGERVYYAIDSHSGGYPYWSTYFGSAKMFETLEKVVAARNGATNASYMREVTNVDIGVLRLFLGEVSETKIAEERKRVALSKLTEDERRLLGL